MFSWFKLSLTCNCCVKHRNNPSKNSSQAAFSFPSQPPKFEFLNSTWLGSEKEFQNDTTSGVQSKVNCGGQLRVNLNSSTESSVILWARCSILKIHLRQFQFLFVPKELNNSLRLGYATIKPMNLTIFVSISPFRLDWYNFYSIHDHGSRFWIGGGDKWELVSSVFLSSNVITRF